MKLFIVGSDKIFAIENFYVRYLRQTGSEVFHFPAPSLFNDYYSQSIFNKVLFRIGLSGIYRRINQVFRKLILEERPQVVWVFKGMELFPETLAFVRSLAIPLVNFNGDNPFVFSGKGSGNSNVVKSIGLYDLHFTYNHSVASELERRNLKSCVLPFGFDVDEALYRASSKEKEIARVCFLGNPDKERGRFIEQLAERDIPITVYGNFWDRFLGHPNVLINPPVYGKELWKVLRQYRVQLNLMRMHNRDSHNMRTFEVPGIGGIMLAPDTPEHRTFFEEEKEIFLYKGLDDCVRQVNTILSLSVMEADAIRTAARRRSISSGYSYEDRAKHALQVLETLIR